MSSKNKDDGEKIKIPYISKPLVMVTELTNNCGLECFFCPRKDVGGEIGFMDMKLFRKLIDEAAELEVIRVIFDKDGDPLLSPTLTSCLEYIRKKAPNMFVSFNTPAVSFKKEQMEGLLCHRLNKICFSVLAHQPETYEKITGVDCLKQVNDNVQSFVDLKNKVGSKTFVVVKMVDVDLVSDDEELDFIKRWTIRGVDKVNVDRCFNWHNIMNKIPYGVGCVSGNDVNMENVKCTEPFSTLNVNWNGKASVCCLDARKEYIVGDLNTQSILDVWRGKKISTYRKAIALDNIGEVEPCKYCERWKK